MRHLSRVILLLLSATAFANQEVIEPTTLLQQKLDNVESLSAAYHQESDSLDVEQQLGHIWLSQPDLFRVESDAPLSQTIVSDGKSLWTYDRDLQQVVITELEENRDQIPVLIFTGADQNLLDQFSVETFTDESVDYFLLQPVDADSLITTMVLAFEGNTPIRLTLEDAQRNRTVITLSEHSNEVLPDRFGFTIPDNVDVIDHRIPETE